MWTRAFLGNAAETAVMAGAASFAASGIFTGGTPSVKGLIAASTAAGIAALYSFVKAYGGNQATKAAAAPKS